MTYTIFPNIEQGSVEWHSARSGIITGTRLTKVIREIGVKGDETQRSKDKRYGLACELIGESVSNPKEQYVSGSMERGHLVESITKELYTEPIESVGFIRGTGNVGISPDAIIREGEIIKRAIEIKSPEAKTTIMYFLEDKIPDEYYWQIIHYFVVIDTLESLDFIVSNPDMHDEFFRLKKKTVYRSDFTEDIQKAKEDIVSFYTEIFVPLSQKLISLKTP